MFLRSLSIKNLRSISDMTLSFENMNGTGQVSTRKQTLLIGQNGTGKTSLLRAIALLTAGSNALGELLGQTDDWIRNGEDQCVLNAVLVNKKEEQRAIQLILQRGLTLREVLNQNEATLDLLEGALEHADRNYFVVGYGASRRLNTGEKAWLSSRESYNNSRSNNVATLFRNDAELNPLTAWAIDLDYQANSPTEGLAIIRESLEGLLPGIRFNQIDKQNKQLLFESTDGLIPLHLLSDGYQNMTAWIGDLLYRISSTFRDYKTPLQARGLLLIDEVDLHIHPVWQRHLLQFLKTKLPNLQLVATTHSPLTAQQASEGELYILQREESNQTVLEPFRGNPQKMLLHQLLMSDAFGLQTDESLAVETDKNKYRALRDKPHLSLEEDQQFRQLTAEISTLPSTTDYSNSLVNDDQMDLLKQISKELKK